MFTLFPDWNSGLFTNSGLWIDYMFTMLHTIWLHTSEQAHWDGFVTTFNFLDWVFRPMPVNAPDWYEHSLSLLKMCLAAWLRTPAEECWGKHTALLNTICDWMGKGLILLRHRSLSQSYLCETIVMNLLGHLNFSIFLHDPLCWCVILVEIICENSLSSCVNVINHSHYQKLTFEGGGFKGHKPNIFVFFWL